MSIFQDQARFMKACGQTVEGKNEGQASLYAALIGEEYNELINATSEENDLKELIDVMVVLIGYGLSKGWDLEGAWDEVWRSNMSKVNHETGMVSKRADGKIMKPAWYIPADVSKFIGV
jgi:predicted HAD superfamily Cof-like phosphohydrolase